MEKRFKVIYDLNNDPIVGYEYNGIIMIHNKFFDGDLPLYIKEELDRQKKLNEILDFINNDKT